MMYSIRTVQHHTRIGEIQKKYKSLSWIRTSMSYHRFPNMRELFSADLSRKLLENVKSLDFETLDCNCRRGICPYNKLCRTPMVVYKATCKTSKMSYIGNTQNHLKKRMQQHFGQVNDVLKNGKKSDTYDLLPEVGESSGLVMNYVPPHAPDVSKIRFICVQSLLFHGR